MTEDTLMAEFIEEFQGIIDEICVSGLTIPEEQQYVYLLGALSPSWRPFISSQGTITNKTISNLIARILEEAAMRNYKDSKQSSITTTKPGAFFVRNGQNKQTNWKTKNYSNNSQNKSKYKSGSFSKFTHNPQVNNKFTSSKPIICHNCGKLGHIRPNCRKLSQNKVNHTYKPKSNQANLTSTESPSINSTKSDTIINI